MIHAKFCVLLFLRDHAGGNEALKKEFKDLVVYGGAKDNVPGATQ